MTRQLSIFVDGNSAGGRRALDEAANSVDHLRRETNRLESEFAQAKREAAALDRQLVETAAATKALNAEFAETGNKKVLKQYQDQTTQLAALTRVRKDYTTSLKESRLAQLADHEAAVAALKSEYLLFAPSNVKSEIKNRQSSIRSLKSELADLGETAAKTGLRLGDAFSGGLTGLLKSPAGLAAAATVAIPATISLGATVGGAIGAGVGAGAAGLAVAGAAAQSKAVRAVWSHEIEGIKEEFLHATEPAVEPTIAAIRRISTAIRGLNLNAIFGDASKFIEPLSKGLGEGLTAAGRGIEYLVHRAGPFVDALSTGAAEIGHGFEVAFKEIADGSDGGADALGKFLHATAVVIEGTGRFIHWMENAYAALEKLNGGIRDVLPQAELYAKVLGQGDNGPKAIARILDFSNAVDKAGGSARYLTAGLADMTSEANLANAAFDRLFGIMINVDTANLQVKEGFADLTKASKEHGVSQDEITEKVLRQIQTLQDQRNAQLATGDGSQAATDRINANYHAQLEQLKKMFPWLDALINKYEDLARPLTKRIDIIISEKRIGNVSVQGVISGGDQRRNTGQGFASGTKSAPPGLAWVGEQGAELIRLNGGERIFNHADSMRMISGFAPPASVASIARYASGTAGTTAASPSTSYALPPLSMIEQALASVIVKLARNGALSIPSSAVV